MFNMTKEELAYLAGIIDGEGCITVCCWRKTRQHVLRLKIANTNLDLMMWLSDKLNHPYHPTTDNGTRRRACYEIAISGRRAIQILEEVYPYLVVKHKQAGLAMDFPLNYTGIPLSSEDRASRERIRLEIMEANHV